MMTTAENKFKKAYKAWQKIDTAADLKKNKLTLAEYHTLTDVLRELSKLNGKIAYTYSDGVANWLKKHGFTVNMDDNKINYLISI